MQGPLTPDLVAASTAGVFHVLVRLLPSLVNLLGAERFFAEVDGAYAGALDRLLASLPDSGSKRSAEWVVRIFRGFTRLFSQALPQELVALEAAAPPKQGLPNLSATTLQACERRPRSVEI